MVSAWESRAAPSDLKIPVDLGSVTQLVREVVYKIDLNPSANLVAQKCVGMIIAT